MRFKSSLLFLSLLVFLSAHLNVCWKLAVNDVFLPGCYSSGQLKASRRISELAAQELCPYESRPPEVRKTLHLSFRPPSADSRILNDFLLLYSSGIELSDGVFVNGTQLGTVEDGRVLSDRLRACIKNQMPNAAVFGSISGKMQIRPVFTARGHNTDYDDMVLLVSGMAPVFYVDEHGHLA